MSSLTSNLKLFKYDKATDGNKQFNIDTALNENWDKIDKAVGSAAAGITQPDGSIKSISEVVTTHDTTLKTLTDTQKTISDKQIADEKALSDHTKVYEIHRPIYSGTTEPAVTLGKDGDLYIQYE